MKIISIIAIFLYTLIFCVLGGMLIALSLRAESLDSVLNYAEMLSGSENVKIGLAVTGFVMIAINLLIAQLSLGKLRKHKTIAFENPYGQVTLSLAAIEDYIRKLTDRISEIKEIKSVVTAGKGGVEVNAKTVLYSDANIPEITEMIQNTIKLRIQEMLGLEEKVTIKIHVNKIIQREKAAAPASKKDGDSQGGFKGEIDYGR